MLNRYAKLLLGTYILRKLSSGNSQEVSERKKNGMLGRYSKLILGTYLMKRLRSGRYFGAKEQEESTGGLLGKFGKMMLTTYAVKKLRPGKSHKKEEKSEQYTGSSMGGSLMHAGSSITHMTMKYGKWLMSGYLLKKLHSGKSRHETKEVVETETYKEKGSSVLNFRTIVIASLVGVTTIYAIKRYRANHNGYRIEVQ